MSCKNITFSTNIAADLKNWLQQNTHFSKIFVITDENTEKCCLPMLNGIHFEKNIRIISDELHKNIGTVQQIWQALLDANADRNSLVVNLGGGVIGDMGGFAAATYKRGIAFVQIPTTLLAMVDASVGGKLGIDFGSIKNSVGVFGEPAHVFIAPIFLETLPERILRSGIAEMIKHEAIAHEKPNFEIDDVPTLDAIRRSVQIKYDIVQQDPFEKNIRKFLNFGHTVGHAFESFFLATDTPLLHGEAVALGMSVEAKMAVAQGFLGQNDFLLLENALKTKFQGVFIPHFLNIINDKTFLKIMENDKKNENDTIKYVALHGFGKPFLAVFSWQ